MTVAAPAPAASTASGLTADEAARRLRSEGPNVVGAARPSLVRTLGAQFRNVVLVLLVATAVLSGLLGQVQDAVVILVILGVSVGLGTVNEYRSARASAAMSDRLAHTCTVRRDGTWRRVDVRDLVVGDLVTLGVGAVVPADLRVEDADGLQCDESVLTGESRPVEKTPGARTTLFQGTVVVGGSGTATVVATGADTEFGRIAAGLGRHQPETAFQAGLARFSVMLVWVAIALMVMIVVTGLLLHRAPITTVLFALAIAVGVTPQLLPAVVSTALASGARALRRADVLVKRLVCVEDLGGVDVLVTDKTGTLTTGSLRFRSGVDTAGRPSAAVVAAAATTVDPPERGGGVAGSVAEALDRELIAAAAGAGDRDVTTGARGWREGGDPAEPRRRPAPVVLDRRPFDHAHMTSSALVADEAGSRSVVVKGATDAVERLCVDVSAEAVATRSALLSAGHRVLAVAHAEADPRRTTADTAGLGFQLDGYLVFEDPPRDGVADSVAALRALGVRIVVATGDDPTVALDLARTVGIPGERAVTGQELAAVADVDVAAVVLAAGVVARVHPEDKADIVRRLRDAGRTVAFLGDGVNDALALHGADVGVSVLSATDVARDAADVVLMDKDLAAVATAVRTGRRVFANTQKYVLMGTSSNIGNMISAAIAASFLPFLPMLPAQVLLNNLVYDLGQLAIPSDRVDPERTASPTHWDIAAVRRFMLTFGPVSSLFDLVTFAVLLGVLHAAPPEFRTAWFVESLLTQSLVVFVIRTARVPSLRSRPGSMLTAAALGTAAVALALPLSPVGPLLEFVLLPVPLLLAIGVITLCYLALVELLKAVLFRFVFPEPRDDHTATHRIRRAAARYRRP